MPENPTAAKQPLKRYRRLAEIISYAWWRRPIVWLLGSYLAGIALGRINSSPTGTPLPVWLPHWQWLGLGLLLLGVIGLICLSRGYRSAYPVLGLAVLAAGWLNFSFQFNYLPPQHISRKITPHKTLLKGWIVAPPQMRFRKTRVLLEAEQIEKDGKLEDTCGLVFLNLYQLDQDVRLRYGEELGIKTKLHLPRSFANPGGFDYREYLKRQGIMVAGNAGGRYCIQRLGWGPGSVIKSWIYEQRSRLSDFFAKEYPRREAGFLRAILLGERHCIYTYLKDEFAKVGLAHLLAISGLHVGFLALLVFGLCRRLLLLLPYKLLEKITLWMNPNQLAALLTLPWLMFYAILAGSRNPIIRAVIMISVYLVGVALDRQRELYNTLALAALIILLWNPQSIADVSFQLSFTTVFFIIYAIDTLAGREKPALPIEPSWSDRLFKRLGEFLWVSLAAYLSSLPLVVYHFNRISVVGFFANLVGIPLAWLIIPTGLSAGLAAMFSPSLAHYLSPVSLWFTRLLLSFVRHLAKFPYASLPLTTPSVPQVIALYGLLLCLFRLRHRWARAGLAASAALAAYLFFWPQVSPNHRPALLEVIFLDVGQGEAILIKTPMEKKILLVGGTRGMDVGRLVVAPYLWQQGITRLDLLVLSQASLLPGVDTLVREFKVGEIWEAGFRWPKGGSHKKLNRPKAYWRLKAIARDRHIPFRWVVRGKVWSEAGGLTVKVLYPPPQGEGRLIEKIPAPVLQLSYGEISFLFTGNIDFKAEKDLLQLTDLGQINIIKSPCRWSRHSHSQPFLEKVRPETAIFSAGSAFFSRPAALKLLSRYRKLGAAIVRTDLAGAVTVTTDGEQYNISTYR